MRILRNEFVATTGTTYNCIHSQYLHTKLSKNLNNIYSEPPLRKFWGRVQLNNLKINGETNDHRFKFLSKSTIFFYTPVFSGQINFLSQRPPVSYCYLLLIINMMTAKKNHPIYFQRRLFSHPTSKAFSIFVFVQNK